MENLSGVGIFFIILLALAILSIYKAVAVVPQSQIYVVERLGKFTRVLNPGLSIITPFIENIAHRVSILERQLPEFEIGVITRDNVDLVLKATVFYRITDAAYSVYRIRDVERALHTEATSIVRSAAGRLELDELQSSRESMNVEVATNLQRKADEWGVEITSTAITDVVVDEQTKEAQRQQLNAERERRAAIAIAEGDKRSAELAADADLYTAQKRAEAVRVTADADAYSVKVSAEADANRTKVIGEAISQTGNLPIKYEVLKRQVEAVASLAASPNSKTLIVPNDVAGTIGSIQMIVEQLSDLKGGGAQDSSTNNKGTSGSAVDW